MILITRYYNNYAYLEHESFLFSDYVSEICSQSVFFLYGSCVCRIFIVKDS
jgi:hypothetical protein